VSTSGRVSDLSARLRADLQGRYTIEHELGRGGMATVFLARDLRHDRAVALKVLHPELGLSLGAERFQREIRLCARLQHPHILTVHDSGEVPGTAGEPPLLWFAMPYIEGETLRSRLGRERQLPIEEALRIGLEAADALDYAHRHGVVHRDIKPENILLTDRHALVADFGIGKALGVEGVQLTETGLALGTPKYMSPEQMTGEKNLDGRSDVYSLGCVLYEMLAGEAPYTGSTAQAIMAKQLSEPVPHLSTLRAVPMWLERAITKALARSPADRFATAADFARALETGGLADGPTGRARGATTAETPRPPARRIARPLAAALAVGLVGLGILFAWRRSQPGAEREPSSIKALAVLPFENLGSADDEYFSDGITDEVRGKLASLPGLQVTARTSSSEYRQTKKGPRQIGRELGVRYLLTGTVRWDKRAAGNRVRVSPELIEVATGATRWQEPFDASVTDVFQVQAEIASRAADALNVALGAKQKQALAAKPTTNLAAYDAFLRGEAAGGANNPWFGSMQRAGAFYEQAVALDSTFAQAWAQLARVRAWLYFRGQVADVPAALHAAERSLALAPNRPEGHLALGDYFYTVGDVPRALESYQEGLRLAPANAELLGGSALAEAGLGRWDASLGHLERARELDPRSVPMAQQLVVTLVRLRRYHEALVAADAALALASDDFSVVQAKLQVYLAQGDLAAARATLRAVPSTVEPTALVAWLATYEDLYWVLDDEQQRLLLRLPPSAFADQRGIWASVRAQAYYLRGEAAKARIYADSARLEFEEQLRSGPEEPQRRAFLGLALAHLGRKAEAVAAGERAASLRPISADGVLGPYIQHQLVRIYILVGEPEKALDQLEPLLKIPYYLSPGWLRIDPNFDPLRKNPRFQRLIQRER
jgi:TolB-like protein/Tfp pilus assembly protein PilF